MLTADPAGDCPSAAGVSAWPRSRGSPSLAREIRRAERDGLELI
jgi:hypothetical protein